VQAIQLLLAASQNHGRSVAQTVATVMDVPQKENRNEKVPARHRDTGVDGYRLPGCHRGATHD